MALTVAIALSDVVPGTIQPLIADPWFLLWSSQQSVGIGLGRIEEDTLFSTSALAMDTGILYLQTRAGCPPEQTGTE
jgi:hypothetical protein